jgi:hypothetical protein
MKKLLEMNYKGFEELQKLAAKQMQLLLLNAETAVANTVLFGVAITANDCPVDTGRARASLAGELADAAGVDIEGDPQAIAEGKSQSVTGFSGLEGHYGSNVEYILYLEYRGERITSRELTAKQLRYLFATGILESDGEGGVKYNYQPRKGSKGFFRNNLPRVQQHFNEEMDKAVKATKEGRLLRKGE